MQYKRPFKKQSRRATLYDRMARKRHNQMREAFTAHAHFLKCEGCG